MANSHLALEAVVRLHGVVVSRCLLRRGRYVIGSERKNEIAIDHESISPQHARLTVASDDEIFIENIENQTGTRIDGAPIEGLAPVALASEITLGEATLVFQCGELPAFALQNLPPDFLRAQRYTVGEVIVQGSTSTIFEARDTALGREVALKIMLPESQSQAATVLRFIREAQVAGQLQHPGVLPIYDLGLDDENRLFCATRFVEGESLSSILDGLAADGEVNPVHATLAALVGIFQKLCDTIAYAHSRHVIHCDLRPENVTVGTFGEVFVGSWNRAKTPQEGIFNPPEMPPLCRYSAPEQAEGAIDDIDECTDIHALGGILFRILTLRDPNYGEDHSQLLEQALSPRPAPAAVLAKAPPCRHWPDAKMPEAVAAIAMKALSLSREDRHESVLDLQNELVVWQHGATAGTLWKQVSGFLGRR